MKKNQTLFLLIIILLSTGCKTHNKSTVKKPPNGSTTSELSEEVIVGLKVLEKIRTSNFIERKKNVLYDERITDEMLKEEFEILDSLNITKKNVKGEIKTQNLYSIIVEEKPGDLDPIIFYQSKDGLKLLFFITNIDGSGLEKDEKIKEQYIKIDQYCDSLKKK